MKWGSETLFWGLVLKEFLCLGLNEFVLEFCLFVLFTPLVVRDLEGLHA
jgi:hypothetical protein